MAKAKDEVNDREKALEMAMKQIKRTLVKDLL